MDVNNIINHRHVLYFTYRFNKNKKLLEIIFVDYNNRVSYGKLELENGLSKKDESILKTLKSEYEPKSRTLTRQSNTQCGFGETLERCCCKRVDLKPDTQFFAGRKIHLSSYYGKLYLSKNKNPRNCRQAMFQNWSDSGPGPMIYLPKYGKGPTRCSLGRRRYFVKDGVVSTKVGVLQQNVKDLNTTVENRKNSLGSNIEIIQNNILGQIKLKNICEISEKFSNDVSRENKRIMVKIGVSSSLAKIFNKFTSNKNLETYNEAALTKDCNNLKINERMFEISPF